MLHDSYRLEHTNATTLVELKERGSIEAYEDPLLFLAPLQVDQPLMDGTEIKIGSSHAIGHTLHE